MKNKNEKELNMLRKENEILKKKIIDYEKNDEYFLSLIKQCEAVKAQFEEATEEARIARNNFIELYKKLMGIESDSI